MNKPFSTLSDAINHWAQVKPDAPALRAPDVKDLSYASLKHQLESSTKQLAELGYGADHRLALVLPQGILLASCLLTLSASCAVFPINAYLTVPELVNAFKKADVSAVLVTAQGSDDARTAAAESGVPLVELGTPGNMPSASYSLRGAPAAAPSSTVMQPDTTAFLISTSGTTGTGKLVPITNRMFAEVIAIKSKNLKITPQDVTLLTESLNLISAISSTLFPVIYRGGCVVVDTTLDLNSYLEHIEQYQPDWLDVSTPMLHAIYNQLSVHPATETIKRLRFMRVGGAPFPADRMRTLEKWSGVPIIHSYGMTEGLSGNLCNPLPPGIRMHESVGVVIHGEISIFSDEGKQLPLTEIGELGIKSPLIFKGYFNPEDNIPSPFKDGWFMTGDLARIDENGYVTIVGRRKEMINSGAMKILPSEVEAAICLHPDAADACVVPLPHPTLGEQVAAAVVRRKDILTHETLVEYLRTCLAAFKIPSFIVFVDEIPRNPGGKIMRTEVIALVTSALERAAAMHTTQPLSETEAKVLAAWHRVLGTSSIGPDEAFLPAGGDSLTSVSLANLLSESFAVDFSAVDIFEYPTVFTQAAEIDLRLHRSVQ